MSRLQAHNYIPRGADLKPSSCEGKAVCCLACTPSTFDSACFQERRSSVSFLHKGPEKGYHISDYIHNPFAYIKQEEISLPQSGTGYINIRSFWTHGFFLLDGFLVLLAIYSESWMFFFFSILNSFTALRLFSLTSTDETVIFSLFDLLGLGYRFVIVTLHLVKVG